MVRLNNMVRFILAVINGTLKVNNRKKADVITDLQAQGFDSVSSAALRRVSMHGKLRCAGDIEFATMIWVQRPGCCVC